jgi:predicted Abi (CAAX) family protease
MNMKRITIFLAIVFIALLCTLLFPQLSYLWLWYNTLASALKAIVDLLQIGLIAVLFAGFLVPLEALGWWAGWYGDKINTEIDPGILEEEIPPQTDAVRYIIYLDGIGQASSKYFPDGENFLGELAAALPDNIGIIRGLIPYSVLNRPLTENGFLSSFWRFAERQSQSNSSVIGALLALAINIRNLLVVAVSADQRFGPIYNQGTAQVMYNSLIHHGYKPGSGVPVTLIGFSGGGQIAMGALSYLKQALSNAPIEIISLAGVISGNNNVLLVEHLYHLVGNKDFVERLGPILFPKRWNIFFLSYWNRAKRMGKISFISLGPVGHMGAGGPLDANKFLKDGRSYLRQTIDIISRILQEEYPYNQELVKKKISNYERYQQAAFNRPGYYPLNQSVNSELYRPIASWMGRLILPPKEQRHLGVLFEVHHADGKHKHLVGQIVYLKWIDDPISKVSVQSTKKDVHFNAEALYNYTQGKILPIRINHWRQVTPLESLAGSRPNDDIVVMLRQPVTVEQDAESVTLSITNEPVQISGRFYGLVKFLQPISPSSEQWRVVHFNRDSLEFDSVEEVVLLPNVIPNNEGIYPSTNRDLEKSSLNDTGWYIYGAKNATGMFVVQALAPRALLRVQPQEVIVGKKPRREYLRKGSWEKITTRKGQIQSVLLSRKSIDIEQAVTPWHEGECALLVHVYGGIGGKKREAAAKAPVYFGHFAYGMAQVVREPLTGELCFDIEYHQVYTHNGDGLIAGTLSWTRYVGDRQFGWLGMRPVCDILIKIDALTEDYDVDEIKRTPLGVLKRQLEIMTARYRIGDGMGATYVGPANNCAQDSNQALYAAIRAIQVAIQFNPTDIPYAIKTNPEFKNWLLHHPEYASSFKQLVNLSTSLKRKLLPFGVARADWQNTTTTIGSSLADSPVEQITRALVSWRTILPRKSGDTVTEIFLQHKASLWILSTSQVGNTEPEIEAIAPFTF